jgi:hypothetical protein
MQDRGGCSVEDFCNHLHRSLLKDIKYVLVWGASSKHYPQRCGTQHILSDEDVVQIVKKKVRMVVHSMMDIYVVSSIASHLMSLRSSMYLSYCARSATI